MSVALHHQLDGSERAPVLVLSNSLGTNLEMWDEQMSSLAEHFRVVRYDQRGHGGSPAPPGPYSIADLGEDVLGLLDRLDLERVSFCGVSLGGMTGMWLAIHAPERINRLALCCTSAHLPPAEDWLERATTVRAEGMGAVVDRAIERWFTPAFPARRPEVVERIRDALLATAAEGYAGCCEAIAGLDLRIELGMLRAPTLVIAAEDDPATPPEHGRLVADAIDEARLLVIEGARHLANVEQPEAVTSALLDHLLAEVPE